MIKSTNVVVETPGGCLVRSPRVLAAAGLHAAARRGAGGGVPAGEPRAVGSDACTSRACLTVLAAASLTETFTALEKQFEAGHPGVDVKLNFAGSSDLAQQVVNGAPADVFAADPATRP